MWRIDDGEPRFFFHMSIGNDTDVEREGENKTNKRVVKALTIHLPTPHLFIYLPTL
jgi:hypothetical protein